MGRLGTLVLAALLGALAAGARADSGADPPDPAVGAGLLPGQLLLRAEPESVVRGLLERKVLVLDDSGEVVRAFVLFDRPVDRVFELLSATDRQGEFRSELERVATVEQLPDGHVDEDHIRILFVEVAYRLRYRVDPAQQRIRWDLDPTFATPMQRIEGGWELFAMDPTHTLGRFSTLVDVGKALPAFLEDAVTRRTLPRTLERCRAWVNADGGAP